MKNEIMSNIEDQFNIIKLRNKLDEITRNNNSVGNSMIWFDIVEILDS